MDIGKLNLPASAVPSKSAIAEVAKATSSIADAIEKLRIPAEMMEQLNASAKIASGAIEPMMKTFGENSATRKLMRQIADQHRALAEINASTNRVPRFEHPRLPPNPIHETNKRLANIEDRFDRMEAIAIDGAKIATGLQATALEFLVKFETAASNNDHAARHAIRLGIIATIIALAMPMTQIIYNEFWRVPADAAAMQATIVQMKREIGSLQETQRSVADQISKSLSQSDANLAAALRGIKEMLPPLRQSTTIQQAD